MTIFVDELRDYAPDGEWCHMWADTETELHEFAKQLGLRREWTQHSSGLSGEFIHYDLRPRKREMALKRGAIYKPLKEYINERLQK
jgi:hypothetical protein